MDPLTTATTFATIVGLMGTFSAERRGAATATYEEFMEWLVKTNHKDVIDLLSRNYTTAISIKALLSVEREELISRLQSLDESLARLATGFEGFKELALAAHPDSELSDQALSILEQFVDSGASKLLAIAFLSQGVVYQFMDAGGKLSISEARFIDDDFRMLVEARLLTYSTNSKGNPIYTLTRSAIKYVEARRNGT